MVCTQLLSLVLLSDCRGNVTIIFFYTCADVETNEINADRCGHKELGALGRNLGVLIPFLLIR